MKVLSLVTCRDPVVNAFQEVEIDDELARKWIADAWAVACEPEVKPVEFAIVEGAPETAVGRRQRRTTT